MRPWIHRIVLGPALLVAIVSFGVALWLTASAPLHRTRPDQVTYHERGFVFYMTPRQVLLERIATGVGASAILAAFAAPMLGDWLSRRRGKKRSNRRRHSAADAPANPSSPPAAQQKRSGGQQHAQ